MSTNHKYLLATVALLVLVALSRWGQTGSVLAGLVQPLNRVRLAVRAVRLNLDYLFQDQAEPLFLSEKAKLLEAELAATRTELMFKQQELETLSMQLGVKLPTEPELVLARVVATSNGLIILDRGEDEGMRLGQTVVLADNLIGQISAVSAHSSKVISLFSDKLKVQAQVVENNGRGVVQRDDDLRLTEVDQSIKLAPGQIVVSSGEDEYLGELVIGKIKKVVKDDREPYQQAVLEPVLQPAELRSVLVIK